MGLNPRPTHREGVMNHIDDPVTGRHLRAQLDDLQARLRDLEARYAARSRELETECRERCRTSDALRKSEEKHRRIVETAGEGFVRRPRSSAP